MKSKYPQLKDLNLKIGLDVLEYEKRWRIINKYKSIGSMHRARFGGLRELVFERDNYCCVICGMTRESHKEEFGRDLTINHINGEGRHYMENGLNPDNRIKNMETLCLRCHGRIDGLKSQMLKKAR